METKKFPTHIVAAGAFIENGQNQLLLVRETRGWNIPGGQVEEGENLIEGVLREVFEESGIEAEIDRLVGVSSNTASYPGWNGYDIIPTKVMFDFAGHFIGGELRGSDETFEARWIDIDKVAEYMTSPVMLDRFEAYLHQENGVQYLSYVTKPEYELNLKRQI